MNLMQLLLIFFFSGVVSCVDLSKEIESKWSSEQKIDVLQSLHSNNIIDRETLIKVVTYPEGENEFKGETYKNAIEKIISKSKPIPERNKLCIDGEVCLTLKDTFEIINNEVRISFVLENLSNYEIEVDSAFFSFQLSSFDLPESFGFINFENSYIPPRSNTVNIIGVDKVLFDSTLPIEIRLSDYKFFVEKFMYHKR